MCVSISFSCGDTAGGPPTAIMISLSVFFCFMCHVFLVVTINVLSINQVSLKEKMELFNMLS